MKCGETGVVILEHDIETANVSEIIVTLTSVAGEVVKKLSLGEVIVKSNGKIVVPLTQHETTMLGRKSDTEVKVEGQIVFDDNPPTTCKTDTVSFTLGGTLNTEFVPGANGTEGQLNGVTVRVHAGVIYAQVNPEGVEEVVAGKVAEAMGEYPTDTEVNNKIDEALAEHYTIGQVNEMAQGIRATISALTSTVADFRTQTAIHFQNVEESIQEIEEARICITPESYGAVGDGVTIDDDAFLEGNYCYQLAKGKVYRVSLNKLRAIHNNPCIGEGVIRFIKTAYYNTHAYQVGNSLNTEVIPTYGDGNHIVEMSARSKKNRLLECINHITDANSNNTEDGKWYRQQAAGIKDELAHNYHGIGAVQRDRDKELPDTFTICLGRQKVLQRKRGSNEWVKTIDELPDIVDGIRNYRLPWTNEGGDEMTRKFYNSPKIVDDHVEIVVTKEEFESWLGSSNPTAEGNLHFWTKDYKGEPDEFYDLIVAHQAWVKEPEAANKLLYTLGVDCFRGYHASGENAGKYDWFSQPVIDVQKHLTNEPQTFYGCTMNVDGALAVDFDTISAIVASNSFTKKSLAGNYNILGFKEDFIVTQGAYTLAYNKAEDAFTISIDENVTAGWQSIDLSSYLSEALPILSGDNVRFYLQVLEGTYGYQNSFYYAPNKAFSLSGDGFSKLNANTATKVTTAEVDSSGFLLGISASNLVYTKFRVWATKGSLVKDYQPYGQTVTCYIDKQAVVNPIIEERISALENKMAALLAGELEH